MSGWTVYVFRRDEGWYPIENVINSDQEARDHAHCNPGTREVIRVWLQPEETVWREGQEN